MCCFETLLVPVPSIIKKFAWHHLRTTAWYSRGEACVWSAGAAQQGCCRCSSHAQVSPEGGSLIRWGGAVLGTYRVLFDCRALIFALFLTVMVDLECGSQGFESFCQIRIWIVFFGLLIIKVLIMVYLETFKFYGEKMFFLFFSRR